MNMALISNNANYYKLTDLSSKRGGGGGGVQSQILKKKYIKIFSLKKNDAKFIILKNSR